jgi:hypothetical protein
MCECLLEDYNRTEDVCTLQVHTTYQVRSDSAETDGFIPRTDAKTEVRLIWLTEDEI